MRFRPWRYQSRLLADRSRRRLVLKARQIGFSQSLALEALHGAITRPYDTTLIISRNGDAARQLIGYCYNALLGLPPSERPRLVKENQGEIELENKSSIVALAATRGAGRSRIAHRVILDEFAWSPYQEEIYRAVSPIVAHGGQLTICSTPWGRNNLFYRLWQGQEGGEWSRHLVDWRQCPLYDEAWYARERPNYTRVQWATEYDCDFIASGLTVFEPGDIERAAQGWKGLQAAVQGRRYVTGVDLGRRRDACVIVTLDVTEIPYQLVHFERHQQLPYPAMQARIDGVCHDYGGVVWVESNGIGDPVIENLTYVVNPHLTTQRSKYNAISALALQHEQGRIKHDIPELRAELLAYEWQDQDLAQDTVMAASIAAYHAEHRPTTPEVADVAPPVRIGPQL
jgi:phage FluMu gp28-like protein